MIQTDLIIILPEIIISVCAMLALVVSVYSGKDALASRLVLLTSALFRGHGAVDWQPGARAKVPLAGCSKMMLMRGSAKWLSCCLPLLSW